MKRQRITIPVDGEVCHKKQRSEGKSKGGITKAQCESKPLFPQKSNEEKELVNDRGSVDGHSPSMRIGGCLGLRKILEYYDSAGTSRLSRVRYDELVYFTQLAIWSYNIKEDSNFDNVQVLRAKKCLAMNSYYYITFKAFSADGVSETFQTKICYYFPKPCSKIEIIFVRIRPSDCDDFAEDSQADQPSNLDKVYKQRLKKQTHDSRFKLAVYLSQYALVNYNIRNLGVSAAVHDIQSLKIIKPMKQVRKDPTYLLTFEASLCDGSKNVETFETEICMRTLFPTTTIEFWNFMIKPN